MLSRRDFSFDLENMIFVEALCFLSFPVRFNPEATQWNIAGHVVSSSLKPSLTRVWW